MIERCLVAWTETEELTQAWLDSYTRPTSFQRFLALDAQSLRYQAETRAALVELAPTMQRIRLQGLPVPEPCEKLSELMARKVR